MSAAVRRLRPATNARLALRNVRSITSNKPLVAFIAVVCTASVLLSLVPQNDFPADDDPALADGLVKNSLVLSSGTNVYGGSSAVAADDDRPPSRLFVERPLVLLTLSYHAAPIYDLMDQLQPLGVQFIERGINAYACRYFGTCRQDGLLEACLHSRPIHRTYMGPFKNYVTFFGYFGPPPPVSHTHTLSHPTVPPINIMSH